MVHPLTECDDSQLLLLLEADDHSHGYGQAAAHLESCAFCRERITDLAADRDTWTDVAESLSDDLAATRVESATNFLEPPSHPEMLGRIGRYDVETVVGSGGMGIVVKAHDNELNRPVAIKVLAPHLAHNGSARQRFAREGRAAAAVVHEHVVAIHNVDSGAKLPYLVMQYVPGMSLQERVDEQGPLQVRELLRVGIQAAAGLKAAHAQGVIHRDVKPSNILLEHGVERVLLTDFGLARVVDDATLTHTGIVAGTPNYMSPEQANGMTTDHRSDLFSLGAVLYFMATGHPPFRGESAVGVLKKICHDRHRAVQDINPDIPDRLADIIDRLLEKKPSRRFSDAQQVHQSLSQLLVRIQRRGVARRGPVRRFVRRHRKTLATSAAMLTLCCAATTWAFMHYTNTPTSGKTARSESPASTTGTLSLMHIAEYDRQLATINEQLTTLESEAKGSTFAHLPDSSWDRQIADMHMQLQRLAEPGLIHSTSY